MEFLKEFCAYGVEFVISLVLAFIAIKCGIALRKKKNEKKASA